MFYSGYKFNDDEEIKFELHAIYPDDDNLKAFGNTFFYLSETARADSPPAWFLEAYEAVGSHVHLLHDAGDKFSTKQLTVVLDSETTVRLGYYQKGLDVLNAGRVK